jgi:cell surface protein SprA
LGNISEDVLKDSYKSFENGLPENAEVIDVDTTVWGRVSTQQLLKQSFTSSTEESRKYQDVGFDGLNDEDEQQFFADYLEQLKGIMNQDAYDKVFSDPSSDNFHYYKGSDYDQAKLDIIQRYKAYNGLDGNSPVNTDNSSSAEPDIEDINRDNTMNETEAYYQYRVSMRPEDLEVGRNHIVDKITVVPSNLPNGSKDPVTWYQFKVPVKEYDEK